MARHFKQEEETFSDEFQYLMMFIISFILFVCMTILIKKITNEQEDDTEEAIVAVIETSITYLSL